MLAQDAKKVFSEVDYILNDLSDETKEKIPKSLRDYIKKNKDKEYEVEISPYLPLSSQSLKKETYEMISFIYLKYICNNKLEKQRLIRTYNENTEKSKLASIKKQIDSEKKTP